VLVVGSLGPPRSHARARAKRRDRRFEGFDFRFAARWPSKADRSPGVSLLRAG
jgi:hypothetical protein